MGNDKKAAVKDPWETDPWEEAPAEQKDPWERDPWEDGAQQAAKEEPRSDLYHLGQSALQTVQGAGQMMSFGLLNPVSAGIGSIAETFTGKAPVSMDEFKKNYTNIMKSYNDETAKYPYANIAGQVGGAFVPSTPAAALGKGVEGTISALSGLVSKAPGIAQTAKYAQEGKGVIPFVLESAGKIGKGAVSGGAQNVAYESVREPLAHLTGQPESSQGLGETFKSGAKFGAGISAIAPAAKAIGTAAKYTTSGLLGPSVKNIDRYLERADEINNAASMTELKANIDETLGNLRADVENGKISVKEASEAAKMVNQRIQETVRDAGSEFLTIKANKEEALRYAETSLKDAIQGKIRDLKSIQSPIEMAPDVQYAKKELMNQINEGSEAGYQVLDKDPRVYSFRGAGDRVRQMADEMNIQPFDKPGLMKTGQLPGEMSNLMWEPKQMKASTSDTVTAGVQAELRRWADILDSLPEAVSADQVKKFLQNIDASHKAIYDNPAYDSRISKAYKDIRFTVDQYIKQRNPEYRSIMEGVKEKRDLLDNVVKSFPDHQTTVNSLNSIGRRTREMDRQTLRDLGDAVGMDFSSPIAKFEEAKTTLGDKSKIESIRQGLPEFEPFKKQQTELGLIKRPEARKYFVGRSLQESGLPKERAQALLDKHKAEQGLLASEEKLAPVSGWSPGNTQAKIERIAQKDAGKTKYDSPGALEERKALEHLSKLSGKDFAREIENMATKEAFTGGTTQGSRRALIFGSLGSIFGAMAGTYGGAQNAGYGAGGGVGVGALLGGLADRYGHEVTKKMLDVALKVQKSGSVQYIKQSNLPQDAKTYLMNAWAEVNRTNKED